MPSHLTPTSGREAIWSQSWAASLLSYLQGPTALVVGMNVRLQRQQFSSPQSGESTQSQNKGHSKLTSPAGHLARGLIKGNRACWRESERVNEKAGNTKDAAVYKARSRLISQLNSKQDK